MNIINSINEIHARYGFLGDLAKESKLCYDNKMYMSALSNLFIVTEQICKYVNERLQGNFSHNINQLKSKNIDLRNKLFHENHGIFALEIDGIVYNFEEPETKKILFEKYAESVYPILERMMKTYDI